MGWPCLSLSGPSVGLEAGIRHQVNCAHWAEPASAEKATGYTQPKPLSRLHWHLPQGAWSLLVAWWRGGGGGQVISGWSGEGQNIRVLAATVSSSVSDCRDKRRIR